MSLLYLMRHGQASFGQDHYDRLSPLGQRQARLSGQALGARGLRLDAAYCGSLARQRDTARLVLEGLPQAPPLTVLPAFNEYDSKPIIQSLLPAMRAADPEVDQAAATMFSRRRSFQLIYEVAMRRWVAGHAVERAESWAAFGQRVSQALEQVRADHQGGKTVMVFTSGGPISAVLRLALGLADQTALELTWVIKNASLSSFLYNQSNLTLSLFNCTAHLEGAGDEDLITYR